LVPLIKEGLVQEWDHLEYLLRKIFFDELRVAPEEYGLVMVDHDLNTNANRDRLLQFSFENLACASFCFVPQSTAGAVRLAPPGKDYLVVYSGYDASYAIPIIKGRPLYEHLTRFEQAGHSTTLKLAKLLEQRGYSLNMPHEIEYVQKIKEICGFVATDRLPVSMTERSYELPDGEVIALRDERYQCAEPIFDSSKPGSCQGAVMETLSKVGNKSLLAAIVLVGGNTRLAGFGQRMKYELDLLEKGQEINVVGSEGVEVPTFVGASLLASSPAFKGRWISKEDYDEHGPSILSSKKLF
jgi:actin, other eukaryote